MTLHLYIATKQVQIAICEMRLLGRQNNEHFQPR